MLKRRSFLKAMGGSAVVLSATGVLGAVSSVKAPQKPVNTILTFEKSLGKAPPVIKHLGDDEIIDPSSYPLSYLSKVGLQLKDTLRNCKQRLSFGVNWNDKEKATIRKRLIDHSTPDLEELYFICVIQSYGLVMRKVIRSINEDRRNELCNIELFAIKQGKRTDSKCKIQARYAVNLSTEDLKNNLSSSPVVGEYYPWAVFTPNEKVQEHIEKILKQRMGAI